MGRLIEALVIAATTCAFAWYVVWLFVQRT